MVEGNAVASESVAVLREGGGDDKSPAWGKEPGKEVDQLRGTVSGSEDGRRETVTARQRLPQFRHLPVGVVADSVEGGAEGFTDPGRRPQRVDAGREIEDLLRRDSESACRGEHLSPVRRAHGHE